MNILIVSDAWSPQVNGVVTTLQQTIKVLESLNHTVMVIHPGMFRSFALPGYSEIRLSWRPAATLKAALESFNPDRIHIATEGPLGLAMRKILRKRRERWSSSFHTKFPDYVRARLGWGRGLVWRWLRKVYRHDAFILLTTESMKQELIDQGFNEAQLLIWGRGVDEQVFNHKGRRNAPGEADILLNVGRVSVEKNLEAFYELKVPGQKIQVGDGPALAHYKAKYPDVEFVGSKFGHELADYYRRADVMVFPSRSDTFGLVMIEAMRCGTPVAAYPVTGPIDVVVNGSNGYMNEDLDMAVMLASCLPYYDVLDSSGHFTWQAATEQFMKALVKRK